MNKDPKEYYKSLGLDPSATPKDIKMAYRKLAKECHPDVNNKESDDKFKKISEAYQVLSDPNKKKQYDLGLYDTRNKFSNFTDFNSIFDAFKNMNPNQRVYKKTDIKFAASINLEKAITGGELKIRFHRIIDCDDCKGKGFSVTEESCSHCGGKGMIVNRVGFSTISTTCNYCRGSGKKLIKCKSCNGQGYFAKEENATISIPPGINKMTGIKISQKGNHVYHGESKILGNAYVIIDFPTSGKGFYINNGHIYVDIKVPFNLIIAQETITVNVCKHRTVTFQLDSTKRSGEEYIIEGMGFKLNHSNLYVKVYIDFPKNNISEEERNKLINILKEIYGEPNKTFQPATIR